MTVEGTLLLINPNSRNGKEASDEIFTGIEALGPVVAPKSLGRKAILRAIEHHASSVRRVVIGGGDGSLHAALPALLDAGLPMGVLPLGTANDFARSLGIADVPEALEVIAAGHTRAVDVGVVNGIHFLNAVGIGLGTEINRNLDRQSKSSFGVFAYLLQGLKNARESRGLYARIACDGMRASMRILQITIANGIHYGGGMTVASDARLNDGLLDVVAIRPQSLARLLIHGPALRSGNIHDNAEIRTFRGTRVSVQTHKPMDVTADGELVTKTPVECHTISGALQVFAPRPTE